MSKWKLVPVEPTPEMLRAGATRHTAYRVDAGSAMFYAYAAMLEAAPQPPKLSDERILELFHANNLGGIPSAVRFARAVEREILGGAQS